MASCAAKRVFPVSSRHDRRVCRREKVVELSVGDRLGEFKSVAERWAAGRKFPFARRESRVAREVERGSSLDGEGKWLRKGGGISSCESGW